MIVLRGMVKKIVKVQCWGTGGVCMMKNIKKKVKYFMLLTIFEKRANSTCKDSFNFKKGRAGGGELQVSKGSNLQ